MLSMQTQPTYGPIGIPMPHQYYHYLHPNQHIPCLATLDLPNLSCLMNSPILYAPHWPTKSTKLPSDIPKFDGTDGEDPYNHVITYHL